MVTLGTYFVIKELTIHDSLKIILFNGNHMCVIPSCVGSNVFSGEYIFIRNFICQCFYYIDGVVYVFSSGDDEKRTWSVVGTYCAVVNI